MKQILLTKMEFHNKNLDGKTQIKKVKCIARSHSLNRDFSVFLVHMYAYKHTYTG